jgi:hypothetical protein
MPRLRPKTVRYLPPNEHVRAVQDLSKGGRYIAKGTWLPRSDEVVLERPDLFEVCYLLSNEMEANQDG